MSWTDEELDALVREAANAKKIAYQDDYWHEMEAMLGKAPSRKVIGWWWFSGIAFLALTLGATVVSATHNDYSQLPNNQIAMSSQNDDLQSITASNTIESGTKIDRNANDSKEIEVQNGNTGTNQSSKSLSNQGSLTTKKTQVSKITNSKRVNAPTKRMRSEGNTKPAKLNKAILDDSKLIQEGILATNGNESEETDANLNDPSPEINDAHTTEVSQISQLNWYNAPFNTFNNSPLDIPYLANKRFGFYVGLHGGLGQSYLATENKNIMYQLGLNGGIEFFVKRWTFGTGIGYRQQFVNNLKMHNERHYYTFGLTKVNQDLQYDQLLFADLNLNVNYSFGRSEFGIQLSPSYMLGARLDYKEKREEILGHNSTISDMPSRNNQFVSSENFKAFSLNIGLNYSFAIRKNTLLQMNLSTRLGENLLNNSFAGNQRTAPMMFECGIKKRF